MASLNSKSKSHGKPVAATFLKQPGLEPDALARPPSLARRAQTRRRSSGSRRISNDATPERTSLEGLDFAGPLVQFGTSRKQAIYYLKHERVQQENPLAAHF